MVYDPETGVITWRIHLTSHPESVYQALTTDEGRATFWAESALERDGSVDFVFPNGLNLTGRVIEKHPPTLFVIDYFGNRVEFYLRPDSSGGTDLTLIDAGDPDEPGREETHAGWVSVLMALKASVDYEIDLRNHDPERSWDAGYADN